MSAQARPQLVGRRRPRERNRSDESGGCSGAGGTERSFRPFARQEIRITGIADCCVRAASGHAAAPPMSVMNSSFGAAIIEKFFLLPNWENVNIFYIIGRPAMMGKADRLPP